MNRLRDDTSDDPLFRSGVELLRKTPPTTTTTDVRLRVWRSIRRAPLRGRVGGQPLVMRLAVAAIVVLGAGTAGAVITHRWIVPRREPAPPPSAPVPATAARPPHPGAAHPAPVAISPVEEPALQAERLSRPPARATKRASVAPSAATSTAPPSVAAAVARERTEVLDALIALRREHDPGRAGTLLARYLAAHPRGTLREEALALAMEAADARGDRAAGGQLARTYQVEFPAGRFLSFARSHTGIDATH